MCSMNGGAGPETTLGPGVLSPRINESSEKGFGASPPFDYI